MGNTGASPCRAISSLERAGARILGPACNALQMAALCALSRLPDALPGTASTTSSATCPQACAFPAAPPSPPGMPTGPPKKCLSATEPPGAAPLVFPAPAAGWSLPAAAVLAGAPVPAEMAPRLAGSAGGWAIGCESITPRAPPLQQWKGHPNLCSLCNRCQEPG